MKRERSFKVKNTKLNMLHNKIRTANALGLISERNKLYKDYRNAGGKRSLKELIKRRPISA